MARSEGVVSIAYQEGIVFINWPEAAESVILYHRVLCLRFGQSVNCPGWPGVVSTAWPEGIVSLVRLEGFVSIVWLENIV